MADLKTIQQQFLKCLLAQESEIHDSVLPQPPVDTKTRLNIYQNAYSARLKETIETDHEILGLYLGDDLFDQMVTGYIEQFPSSNPSLRHFCRHLPTFLRKNAPFSEHPLLAELAAFEQRLINAFDAPETQVASIEHLMTIPPEHWPEITLRFHPSVQLFSARWNSVESWQHLKQEMAPPTPVESATPAVWVLWRNQERLTEFRSVDNDEQMLFELALKGGNFSQMCDELLDWHEPEQVAQRALALLQQWIYKGLISHVKQS